VSIGRKSEPECSVEQSAVLKTGQIVVQFRVVIPSPSKPPVMLVQLPLGILLQPGLRLKVDDGKVFSFAVQTCEQRGCVVTAPLPPELLALMKSGKTLSVSFTSVANETADVPLQLSEFAGAYAKIE
jgi:invasion protein IalB